MGGLDIRDERGGNAGGMLLHASWFPWCGDSDEWAAVDVPLLYCNDDDLDSRDSVQEAFQDSLVFQGNSVSQDNLVFQDKIYQDNLASQDSKLGI